MTYLTAYDIWYEPIDHQAYRPSSLSTIEPINHQAYQPSSLSTIEPIDHRAYWPSSLSTSGLLSRLLSLLACLNHSIKKVLIANNNYFSWDLYSSFHLSFQKDYNREEDTEMGGAEVKSNFLINLLETVHSVHAHPNYHIRPSQVVYPPCKL